MTYNYKVKDYVSKNQSRIDDLDNQIANHDQTYDYTKDAGWIAADKQIKDAAKVLASQELGRMGNRIGTKGSWEDTVIASIGVQADKNSQNLIPTFQRMALDKLKSQRDSLAQREQQDYNNWLASENLNLQNYARQLTQQNTDRQLKLQEDQLAFQKDQYNDSKNATPSMDLSELAKFAQIDADYGTNYVNQLFGVTPNATGKPLIDTTGASAAAKAFPKVIFSKEMFDNSSNTKKEYGTYQNYVQQQIMKGYQKGNLSVSDVNWLKRYYGF